MLSPAETASTRASSDPSAAEIRSALETMLASEVFRTSPQLAAFLRYAVEAVLRGEGAFLKGYTIAVAALGREKDFDPEGNPIVRVAAGRLRRAIQRYYEGPGASDLVVIDLPRGGYAPTFGYRSQVAPARSLPVESFVDTISHGWNRSLGMMPRARLALLFVPLLILMGAAALLIIG